MPSKEGWTHDRDHEKITLGKKQYRNMEEWSRPCSICAERFSIFVRTNGNMVNASFGLKTCKEHRGQKIAGGVNIGEELDRLRTANVTMSEELAGVYARNKELFEELQVCKARLAQYELPAAFAALDLGQEQKVTTTNGALPEPFPWG